MPNDGAHISSNCFSLRHAQNLWSVIFQLQGSVLIAVFPFCVLNCSLLAVVIILAKNGVDIAFSPSGHTLMTLIISFLVISKVNMGYERYMSARNALGDALTTLRELNQLAFTYSEHDRTKSGSEWRGEVRLLPTNSHTISLSKQHPTELQIHSTRCSSFLLLTVYNQNLGFDRLYHAGDQGLF